MADLPTWISPAKAANMVTHVRQPEVEGLRFALFKPKPGHTVAGLAFAKLNPVMPRDDSPRTRCGWPATARDHRLVLAPGTPDPVSLDRLFGDYDRATVDHQALLAAVLTVPFDRDRPLHDQFDQLIAFAMTNVALDRRLTSLAVCHAPGDGLAREEGPHGHLLVLARVSQACGWQAIHPELAEGEHAAWADEWTRFGEGWSRLKAA